MSRAGQGRQNSLQFRTCNAKQLFVALQNSSFFWRRDWFQMRRRIATQSKILATLPGSFEAFWKPIWNKRIVAST
jgi:hypothetical protein